MPLKVTIEVTNQDETQGSTLGTLYIGRRERLNNFDQVSHYTVGETMEEAIDGYVGFTHRYSDGYETCVRKAIEAREKAGLPL